MPSQPSVKSFDGFLTMIHVVFVEGAVRFERQGTMLIITGSLEGLCILKETIIWLSEQSSTFDSVPPHLHIEYFPEHFYLASSSTPIIRCGWRAGDGHDGQQSDHGLLRWLVGRSGREFATWLVPVQRAVDGLGDGGDQRGDVLSQRPLGQHRDGG